MCSAKLHVEDVGVAGQPRTPLCALTNTGEVAVSEPSASSTPPLINNQRPNPSVSRQGGSRRWRVSVVSSACLTGSD